MKNTALRSLLTSNQPRQKVDSFLVITLIPININRRRTKWQQELRISLFTQVSSKIWCKSMIQFVVLLGEKKKCWQLSQKWAEDNIHAKDHLKWRMENSCRWVQYENCEWKKNKNKKGASLTWVLLSSNRNPSLFVKWERKNTLTLSNRNESTCNKSKNKKWFMITGLWNFDCHTLVTTWVLSKTYL